jgi:uncharacterized protein YcbK (DUF882 family)
MRSLSFVAVVSVALSSAAIAYGEPPRPSHARPLPGKPAAPAAKPAPKAPKPYQQAMVGWHAPIAKGAPVDATGRPMLVLHSINRNEKAELTATTDAGGFSARDLDRAAWVLRAMSGDEHPMEPRTLNIIYRIQTHFAAPEIRIVSGYRVPKPNSHSNHGKGRAIDFIVPGTPDAEVAKFAREIGFVGVGIYPTSQFVHVDVRPRSYFWIDYSGPGKRNRERGILPELAIASDKRALARGERGIDPFVVAGDVDLALKARGVTAPAPADDDDEDGD